MDVRLVCKGDNRIGEDGKIGTGTDAFDGVGVRSVAGVKAGGGGGGKVAAGAEAHDADLRRVDQELRRPRADVAKRPLRIAKHHRMPILRAQPITQYKRGNALRVQPLGDLLALVIKR